MKTLFKSDISFIFQFLITVILFSSCDFDNSSISEKTPEISTLEVTSVTPTTVYTGGNIIANEGTNVTARGVCWSTGQNPTIDHNKTVDGTGSGSFTSSVSALEPNTTHYIRAYATYEGGTVYGDTHNFTTPPFGTIIVDVTNPITGRTWMDRNLGAKRVATSSTDEEAYGDLYQWGRGSDGHEKRDSPTIATFSSSDNPGHASFIQSHTDEEFYDWRRPQNTNLWQGVDGVNNPCPPGYRIPTEFELQEELDSWSSKNADGAFASPLKFTLAGVKNPDGSLAGVGILGAYWSRVSSGIGSHVLKFQNENEWGNVSDWVRGFGSSVRCIRSY